MEGKVGAKGIRISDCTDNVVTVNLLDILTEVKNGESFFWSILFLDATGDLGENISIPEFCKEIRISEKGFFISWKELYSLAGKFWQVIDITLLGCKNKSDLHRYKRDQEKYETCDFVIQMCDSSFWEIFSKDNAFIWRLASKFKEIEFLETDLYNEFDIYG